MFAGGFWGLVFIVGFALAVSAVTSNMDAWREKMEILCASLDSSKSFVLAKMLLSFMQCVHFVVRAYTETVTDVGFIIECVACVFYLVSLVTNCLLANLRSIKSGFIFMFSSALADVIILGSTASLPIIKANGLKCWFSPSFVAAFHLLACWNLALPLLRVNTQVPRNQIMDMMVSTLLKVYLMAMAMMSFENMGDPQVFEPYTQRKWNTISSVYFVITTVSTVGFGDLAPTTSLGRFTTIILILGGFFWAVNTVQSALQIMVIQSSGGGYFEPPPNARPILIIGNPTAEMLRTFISEVFHPDHAEEADDVYLSILISPGSPEMDATVQFLKQPENLRLCARVHIFQGSALDSKVLLRVGAASAACIFILPNFLCTSAMQDDTENIMRMTVVQRLVPDARIVLLLLKAEDRTLLAEANMVGEVTCLAFDEFKFALAGKSCEVHGFSSLITTLCKSMSTDDEDDGPGQKDPSFKPSWRKDFERGCGLELYEVLLSSTYAAYSATFIEVMVDIIEQTGGVVYLIGLVESRPESKTVMVNPGPSYPIKNATGGLKVMGLFLASSREAIIQCEPGMVFLGRRERPNDEQAISKKGGQLMKSVEFEEEIADLAHVNLSKEQKVSALKLARTVRRHRRAMQPNRPPLKLLAEGGHVLIICVGTQSSEDLRLGVEHFVKPLRSPERAKTLPIVVLSFVQPRDWYSVHDEEQVFFVQGSPTSLLDLQRVNFSGASAIFISHCGSGRHASLIAQEPWTVDFEVISCTRLIESHFPSGSKTFVMADIVIESNHPFLPLPEAIIQSDEATEQRKSLRASQSRRTSFFEQGPYGPDDAGEVSQQEESYCLQPRFAAGKLFAGSGAFTNLAANTFYNPSLIDLVSNMINTELSMIRLPVSWEGKTYCELVEHLLWNEKLLAVGIYRYAKMTAGSTLVNIEDDGKQANGKEAKQDRQGFIYVAPPGKETALLGGDQILCFHTNQDS